MFGFLQSNPDKLTRIDINRLNQIDSEYMRAYSVKTVDGLRGMLAPACLEKVSWVVLNYNSRYFADEKFRHTEWILIRVTGNFYTIKKQVTFDKIRINAAMSINASTNYAEQWVVSKKNELVVLDIEKWVD